MNQTMSKKKQVMIPLAILGGWFGGGILWVNLFNPELAIFGSILGLVILVSFVEFIFSP